MLDVLRLSTGKFFRPDGARRGAVLLWFATATMLGCVHTRESAAEDPQQAPTMAADPVRPAAANGQPAGNVNLPRFPSISPDGRHVVFSWRGDLWKVAAEGGHATRITRHRGDELRSAWSADGSRIAFDSDRNGFLNLYTVNAEGTDIRQITDLDRACTLTAYGVDSEGRGVVTFQASLEGDVYRSPRPYRVSDEGGEVQRVCSAYATEAVPGPDGDLFLITRGGSSWSRRHYRGPDHRDVWTYRASDDSFARLTEHPGNDGMARFDRDGRVYFASDRDLQTVNLFRMDSARGGRARRLTAFSGEDVQSFDVSLDGRVAVMCVWDKLYTLDLTDDNAKPVAMAITGNEDYDDNYEIKTVDREVTEAALSPDGQVLAVIAYGEVFVRNIDEKSPSIRVTYSHAREKQLAWSPDGLRLYFVSDSDGRDSIYAAAVEMTRSEVKKEFEKALKPAEAKPEDKPTEAPKEEAPKADDAAPAPTSDEAPAGEAEKKADEPKTDKPAKKKPEELPKELDPKRWHDAIRFTVSPVVQTEHEDRSPSPSPNGKHLAFRRGRGDLMILDLPSGEPRALVTGWDFALDWRWSPDSRFIAYEQNDINFNSDIWIVPADGSKPAVNISRHPNNDGSPRFSADGKILAFLSNRVADEYDVWSVYLDADLESYTPRELETYYDEAVKAAKKRKPLAVEKPKDDKAAKKDEPAADEPAEEAKKDDEKKADDAGEDKKEDGDDAKDKDKEKDEPKKEEKAWEPSLDDAWLRLRRITTLSGDEGSLEITPGGDRYIFAATIGDRGLYSLKWDGEDRKKLTDAVSVQQVSLTGDKIVIVGSRRGGTIKVADSKVEYLDIADKIRIDLMEQSSQKFLEAARTLGELFYHPTMKDLDWPALSLKYHELAKQARRADEFNEVANRFIGELNGSHLRISAREETSPNALAQGRLGTIHRRTEGGFEIVRVLPNGPAALGPMALKVGDVVTAIDMTPLEPGQSIESRLAGRAGRETIVTIRRTVDGADKELNILLTPVSGGAEIGLRYDDWRLENARLVSEWSGGRLGYIHIRGMDQGSLDVFERDLFAAADGKQGLLIDVRNNGGGWTADRLLSSIMVQKHAYTIPRGGDPSQTDGYPQDRLFIQRYTLPINMLCNEKSFSNAEITSHAFKTLKRGTLVGQQTYGGVISTGGTTLIDGTTVRLPFRGWYLPDGTDMENNGAIPDIIVPQTPEAESRNEDEQLRVAVEDLLKRL
jgi:tricorn protease